ncbi:MAG: phenylalanine--tRNA ligase subunit beta [Halothermotrichaceae bacterium]
MRVSYNWLKTYIDFPYTPAELDHVLTMAGLEVDEVEFLGKGIEDIIVAEVIEVRDHPNADKLVICDVNTGSETLQIVTGAPNVEVGVKSPLAQVGVTLPGGMKMKKVKLRGEVSFGMLCSTDELGLSEERASGIMVLDDDAEVGSFLIDYLGLNDYVLKLDLTPNYARCLGMLGIARELKAILEDKDIKYPEIDIAEKGNENIKELVDVEVKDKELCPRYTGRIIKNVEIGPSPDWMQRRLEAADIRPINNLVDITNYVLLEYNQPLHAFDYDKISGKKVIVRRAEKDEKLITLDDKERQLDENVLVISDKEKAVGLAGVMGGANSEVTEDTTTIFLESAYFNPVNIRKTAKTLGLPSEASHRFERGIDIGSVVEASNRAAYLFQEYAGGEIVPGIIDMYPESFEQPKIKLETDLVNKILGLSLSSDEIKEMLQKLQFNVEIDDDKAMTVTVPLFRNDVEREADLIEEVARMYGYNNIPVTKSASKQQGRKTYKQRLEDITRDIMSASGLDEVINFSLTEEADYQLLNIDEDSPLNNWVKIKNPLNESYAIMRTSLIPGILKMMSNNAKRQVEELTVFELGNIYFDRENEDIPYQQEMRLTAGCMGRKQDYWNSSAPGFFYMKGVLETFFEKIGIKDVVYEPSTLPYLHPGRTAEIKANGENFGYLGELMPGLIEDLDLIENTTVFELNFDKICQVVDLGKEYQPLPKYPAVERDLAVLVNKDINAGLLLQTIEAEAGSLLKNVALFDLYQGDQIPEALKSLAFKLVFQAKDRTLRDKEVNKVFQNVMDKLEDKYEAKIRGN